MVEVFFFIFEDTLTRAKLDIYRSPLESEKFSDLILDIARIGKVELVRVID